MILLEYGLCKATAARLDRSYKNGPKGAQSQKACTGVCHLCLAGRPFYDFEDVHLGFAILSHCFAGSKLKKTQGCNKIKAPCVREV